MNRTTLAGGNGAGSATSVDGRGRFPLPRRLGPLVPGKMRLKLAEPVPSTTRQTEVLNPAIIGAPTGSSGVTIGRDLLSGSLVAHDPFTAYEMGVITSPNVVIIGDIGSGKSSCNKTIYVLRPLTLKNRRCLIIDRKTRDGRGEYCELVERYGRTPFTMSLDGNGTRLNVLDPIIYRGAGSEAQLRLLQGLAEIARVHRPLDPWELKALRMARSRALAQSEAADRTPILETFVPLLGAIDKKDHRSLQDAGLQDASRPALERLHQAGLELRFLFEDAVMGALSGLFNGPTSSHVSQSLATAEDGASQLDSFDVSQLPADGPSVAMVTAVANSWLMGTLTRQPGLRTYFLAEEGWHLIEGAGGRLLRANSKLARGLGLSNVITFHRPGDVPMDSPGISVLKEAQTIHIYRQERVEDVEACMRMYDLAEGAEQTLQHLPQGEHLLKIGSRREVRVQHLRSDIEVQLTDTDSAMRQSTMPGTLNQKAIARTATGTFTGTEVDKT